jgi:hypothetical protein
MKPQIISTAMNLVHEPNVSALRKDCSCVKPFCVYHAVDRDPLPSPIWEIFGSECLILLRKAWMRTKASVASNSAARWPKEGSRVAPISPCLVPVEPQTRLPSRVCRPSTRDSTLRRVYWHCENTSQMGDAHLFAVI